MQPFGEKSRFLYHYYKVAVSFLCAIQKRGAVENKRTPIAVRWEFKNNQ